MIKKEKEIESDCLICIVVLYVQLVDECMWYVCVILISYMCSWLSIACGVVYYYWPVTLTVVISLQMMCKRDSVKLEQGLDSFFTRVHSNYVVENE